MSSLNQYLKLYPTDLPYSLTGSYCHIEQPILHLQNQESHCLRKISEMPVFIQNLRTKLNGTKILKSRSAIDNHAMMGEYCMTDSEGHSKHDCFDMQMFLCNEIVTKNSCHLFNDSIVPVMLVNRKVLIDFLHNFTNILNSSAYFVYNELNMNEMGAGQFVHTFKIRFLQENQTKLEGNIEISGNLGYIQQNPLLISRLVPANSSMPPEKIELVLEYFHENKTYGRDVLKLPKFSKNNCHLNNATFSTINFDENVYLKCDILLDEIIENITSASNFSEICLTFQQRIFYYILHSVDQKFLLNSTEPIRKLSNLISEFGNPRNNTVHWMDMKLLNFNDNEQQSISADYDRDESESVFTCRNMILNVKYEFLWARLLVDGVPNQRILKEASLELGTRLDLQFIIGEEMKVPGFVDVMFLDLTTNGGMSSGAAGLLVAIVLAIFVVA